MSVIPTDAEIDHIKTRDNGGLTVGWNLQAACGPATAARARADNLKSGTEGTMANTRERGRVEFHFKAPSPTWLVDDTNVEFTGGTYRDAVVEIRCWKQGHDTSFWVTTHLEGRDSIVAVGPPELGAAGPDVNVVVEWTSDAITTTINGLRYSRQRA